MRTQKKQIWMKVEGYEAQYLETVRNLETAEMKIKYYEKQDRYAIEVEGYTNSIPTYEIR